MSEHSGKPTLMQVRAGLSKQILITAGIMFTLILLVYSFNIPNPNMILIAGLVLCSALFGYGGGITAAIIMLGYSLYFFSDNHSFVSFSPRNAQKVLVSLIGILADFILVCQLKSEELAAFDQVEQLTDELHRENQKLHQMSLTDALTGCRNRLALRQDYNSFQGRTVSVAMIDLNNFKDINDSLGHETGDRVLKDTAALLADTFGRNCCYRYGGDEFLVIVPDCDEKEFDRKLEEVTRLGVTISETRKETFSAGSVHAAINDSVNLRDLIREADEKMYQVKRGVREPVNTIPDLLEADSPALEFTVKDMKQYLDSMAGKYDLARIVDPTECRILDLQEDGTVSGTRNCYSIWNSSQRCLNCSSAMAGRTGCHQTKAEEFQDQLYYIQSTPVALKLPDGSNYDAVVELVQIQKDTELHGNEREQENIGSRAARYFAQHDSMTNVLNAEAFYELSRERIQSSPSVRWVMITSNIMNFRFVNTLFGDQKGNEVLIRTAALLRGISERAEGLCGRLGGDQFALLLPKDRYREESLLNTEKILANAFNTGMYTFCLHFGVYEVEDENAPVSVMCGRANSALRTIRENLSVFVAYFNEEIRHKIMLEQTVISGFAEALKENQFHMYLQPVVTEDGKAIGAEALVRWHRPDGTVMMPGDFIETLERAGLIQKLDCYMWELAVKQLSEWKNTEWDPLWISVNLSARDFYSIDVYQTLTGLVERYSVDYSRLRIELTETALMTEPKKSCRAVRALREKGFIVEIDDFGKGYSSLGLLKEIEADVLKIDMSFVQEVETRARSSAILQAIIWLAQSLGMDVITEGVETERQLNHLTKIGCPHFQGYYFSRPLPLESFLKTYNGDQISA
ncbi:MAG: EAL domain-containing protein [Solobacterium sp.]|nr:EAL domain-containing protein [Solobacterium sp.]